MLFRLVWPTAILFAATLAVVFVTIRWTSGKTTELTDVATNVTHLVREPIE